MSVLRAYQFVVVNFGLFCSLCLLVISSTMLWCSMHLSISVNKVLNIGYLNHFEWTNNISRTWGIVSVDLPIIYHGYSKCNDRLKCWNCQSIKYYPKCNDRSKLSINKILYMSCEKYRNCLKKYYMSCNSNVARYAVLFFVIYTYEDIFSVSKLKRLLNPTMQTYCL